PSFPENGSERCAPSWPHGVLTMASTSRRRVSHRQQRYLRPRLETLEDRTLLDGNTLLAASRADFLTGIDRYLGEIQNDLSVRLFGFQLPLIGDALKRGTGAQFVGDVRQQLNTDLGQVFPAGVANPVQVVRQQLYNTLGPDGLQVLSDTTGDGQVT